MATVIFNNSLYVARKVSMRAIEDAKELMLKLKAYFTWFHYKNWKYTEYMILMGDEGFFATLTEIYIPCLFQSSSVYNYSKKNKHVEFQR